MIFESPASGVPSRVSKKGACVYHWPVAIQYIFIVLFQLFSFHQIKAQTPTDAILMPAGDICALVMYNQGHFDQYWEGDLLRGNQTIQTVTRKNFLPMAAVGITPWLNAYVGLPYIQTSSSEPNGGKFAGASGFQDISVALKAKFFESIREPGTLSIFSSAGYSRPVTNYLGDYLPYSLGLGDQQIQLRAIAQYKFGFGLSLRASGGYHFRGYSKAERDYYYNNGSYYTPYMDVPGAWVSEAAINYCLYQNQIKLEVAYSAYKSTSGDDVRVYNAAQPTNKTQSKQVGGSIQYYPKFGKGLGIIVGGSQVFDGRNGPKMTSIFGGFTYQFTAFKQKESQNP